MTTNTFPPPQMATFTDASSTLNISLSPVSPGKPKATPASKGKKGALGAGAGTKRRCVSNACVACRKRKSKCDGNEPSCAACASVYNTECVYDPNSDHRRKGVYRKPVDSSLTRSQTLQILMQAILNFPEEHAWKLFQEIRTCESLEAVAESITSDGSDWKKKARIEEEDDRLDGESGEREESFEAELADKMAQLRMDGEGTVKIVGATSSLALLPASETQNEMMAGSAYDMGSPMAMSREHQRNDGAAIASWTTVTSDVNLIRHLIKMYFTWHYPYFTALSRELFEAEFYAGFQGTPKSPSPPPTTPGSAAAPSPASTSSSTISMFSPSPSPHPSRNSGNKYCSPLLVNAMLALGCHFTTRPGSRADPSDPDSTGDHFFREAKRILMEQDEHEVARLTTVQALALMSVREAGCGREGRGWVYSGMSFRMALDMGLHLEFSPTTHTEKRVLGERELDARRVTFWGCFLFDKCWSNYLGRRPQLSVEMATVKKYDVFPDEEARVWRPYTANGESFTSAQPARTRTVGLRISELCEISDEILLAFYCGPGQAGGGAGTGMGATTKGSSGNTSSSSAGANSTPPLTPANKLARDLKLLSQFWGKLEGWRARLPKELAAREGALPPVLLMHMFHQLLYIHLFRPFLGIPSKQPSSSSTTGKISADSPGGDAASPSAAAGAGTGSGGSAGSLPSLTHLNPRKQCLHAAAQISKFLRFYKREYGLRQICNVAAYILLSAATIHLLDVSSSSSSSSSSSAPPPATSTSTSTPNPSTNSTAKRDIHQALLALEEIGKDWLCAKRAVLIFRYLVYRWKIQLPPEAMAVLERAEGEGRFVDLPRMGKPFSGDSVQEEKGDKGREVEMGQMEGLGPGEVDMGEDGGWGGFVDVGMGEGIDSFPASGSGSGATISIPAERVDSTYPPPAQQQQSQQQQQQSDMSVGVGFYAPPTREQRENQMRNAAYAAAGVGYLPRHAHAHGQGQYQQQQQQFQPQRQPHNAFSFNMPQHHQQQLRSPSFPQHPAHHQNPNDISNGYQPQPQPPPLQTLEPYSSATSSGYYHPQHHQNQLQTNFYPYPPPQPPLRPPPSSSSTSTSTTIPSTAPSITSQATTTTSSPPTTEDEFLAAITGVSAIDVGMGMGGFGFGFGGGDGGGGGGDGQEGRGGLWGFEGG